MGSVWGWLRERRLWALGVVLLVLVVGVPLVATRVLAGSEQGAAPAGNGTSS